MRLRAIHINLRRPNVHASHAGCRRVELHSENATLHGLADPTSPVLEKERAAHHRLVALLARRGRATACSVTAGSACCCCCCWWWWRWCSDGSGGGPNRAAGTLARWQRLLLDESQLMPPECPQLAFTAELDVVVAVAGLRHLPFGRAAAVAVWHDAPADFDGLLLDVAALL